MNLYLLTRPPSERRDEMYAIVVVADDEKTARGLAADLARDEGPFAWWTTGDCAVIGTAHPGVGPVVCADVFEG